MSLGQTYFLQVKHYACNKNTRAATLLGTVNIYIPYAPSAGRPSNNTRIMRYGLIDTGYTAFSSWMPDFSVVTCPAIFGYGSSIAYPKAHYNNLFPATHCTYMGGFANVSNNMGDLWENPANGAIIGRFASDSNSRYWASMASFTNGDAGTNISIIPWAAMPYNGSGSQTGQIQYLGYADYDSDLNLPKFFCTFTMGGALSSTNDIYLASANYPNSPGIDSAFYNWMGNAVKPVVPTANSDPYDDLPTPGDDPLPGGGAVGIPGFPGLTATSAGVIGLFCPSVAQMQLLADFMWTDFGGSGTTVEDILKEVVEAIKRTISNPLDYIVGLNIIPSQGLSIGGSKSVRFGFVDSGVTMPLLANQYFTVDCGSIAFDVVCGDTFLDYAPYAKFSIYLPYIGFKDVDPNDFVGHSIGVVYHGDCVTGGITAYITKDGSVMYQYSGCCALNVPLSADSWGETISGAISVATGIVAAAATGGAAGVGLAAAKGAASVAANPSLLSPQVNHSGAVSGGAGCMGVQYPFVIREAVNFHSTANFNKESGYPAYYYKALSEVTGFTTVLDPHINNIPQATQGEMSEIISLLESGVIL